MNKKDFLDKLSRLIRSLPQSEIDRITNYYSETIADRMDEGMSEFEAVASLEDVEAIARQCLFENSVPEPKPPLSTGTKAAIIVFMVVGSPIWLPVVISVLSAILVALVSMWVALVSIFVSAIAMAISAVISFIYSPFVIASNPAYGIFAIGSGIFLAAVSICIFLAALKLSSLFVKFHVFIFKKVKEMFMKWRWVR